jgi:hypothetical protein
MFQIETQVRILPGPWEGKMKTKRNSIGKEKAIALAESKWWEGKSHREIAEFQLFLEELCMPFDVFHEAIEKSLGRPVFTHEFGLNYEGLVSEFLGDRATPSLQEIFSLIPEEKRIILEVPS